MPGTAFHRHRSFDADWVPVVGEVICYHPVNDHKRGYLARIVQRNVGARSRETSYAVRPLGRGQTNVHSVPGVYIERTVMTFEGWRCTYCKQGNIR